MAPGLFLDFLFFYIENVSHLEITWDIIYDDIGRDEDEIYMMTVLQIPRSQKSIFLCWDLFLTISGKYLWCLSPPQQHKTGPDTNRKRASSNPEIQTPPPSGGLLSDDWSDQYQNVSLWEQVSNLFGENFEIEREHLCAKSILWILFLRIPLLLAVAGLYLKPRE